VVGATAIVRLGYKEMPFAIDGELTRDECRECIEWSEALCSDIPFVLEGRRSVRPERTIVVLRSDVHVRATEDRQRLGRRRRRHTRAAILCGQGAFFERGEMRSKGSRSGMVAGMVRSSHLEVTNRCMSVLQCPSNLSLKRARDVVWLPHSRARFR